jgi:hypothetical protein
MGMPWSARPTGVVMVSPSEVPCNASQGSERPHEMRWEIVARLAQ